MEQQRVRTRGPVVLWEARHGVKATTQSPHGRRKLFKFEGLYCI
jgi:hypothetical protein